MRLLSADKQEIVSSQREQHNKNNLACMCAHLNMSSTLFIGDQWKAASRCVLAKKKKKIKYKNHH